MLAVSRLRHSLHSKQGAIEKTGQDPRRKFPRNNSL